MARSPSRHGWRLLAAASGLGLVAAVGELVWIIQTQHYGADHWLIFGLYIAVAGFAGASALARNP